MMKNQRFCSQSLPTDAEGQQETDCNTRGFGGDENDIGLATLKQCQMYDSQDNSSDVLLQPGHCMWC